MLWEPRPSQSVTKICGSIRSSFYDVCTVQQNLLDKVHMWINSAGRLFVQRHAEQNRWCKNEFITLIVYKSKPQHFSKWSSFLQQNH